MVARTRLLAADICWEPATAACDSGTSHAWIAHASLGAKARRQGRCIAPITALAEHCRWPDPKQGLWHGRACADLSLRLRASGPAGLLFVRHLHARPYPR